MLNDCRVRGRFGLPAYGIVPALPGVALAAGLLAGCAGGTGGSADLPAPDRGVPADYAATPVADDRLATADVDYAPDSGSLWWTVFDDPILNRLVTGALPDNPDVMVARSRLREARALARQDRAGLFPTFDFGATGEGRSNIGLDPTAPADNTGLFDAGFDAAWEIDLFGRARRSAEAADAGAQAAQARLAGVLVSLTAEVATAYIDLRSAQATLAVVDESIDLQRHTRDLVHEQMVVGVASPLDADRAEAALLRLQAGRPSIRAEIDRAINRLAVLSGRPPGTMNPTLANPQPIPAASAAPDPGVPADLLRQRPDLRAAEQDIEQAAAGLDVAVADLYPRLSIPGSISISATGLGTGSIVQTVVSSLSAVLSVPLFDGGRRRAAVDAAEEQAHQALFTYRRTLLLALEEVETALVEHREASDRLDILERTLDTTARATNRATARFQGGMADFLEVLDAQRERVEIARERAQARADAARAVVRLHKAIGGGVGWLEATPHADAEIVGAADNAIVEPEDAGAVMQSGRHRPG
ncbi:efflux transporter outer membrane subunit [Fodinicurvata sp. EGI_FJ10296]|uniref:efflux transporter outer membrane subunit n=1 Tax=Fodinicurvata sp. EGI_FJ10296 TaxID=3231908 RepID=UPI003452F0E6